MPNLVDTISSTYLVITGELCTAVVLCHMHVKVVGLYVHLSCWHWDLHLQCGSHISAVIYSKYVNSHTGSGHLIVILEGKALALFLLKSSRWELFESVQLCSEDTLRMASLSFNTGNDLTQTLFSSTKTQSSLRHWRGLCICIVQDARRQSSLSQYNSFTQKMVWKWKFLCDTGEDSACSLLRSLRRQNSWVDMIVLPGKWSQNGHSLVIPRKTAHSLFKSSNR